MRRVLKPAASYAVLLILLFAIAALAVRQTLLFIGDRLPEHDYIVVAVLVCFITYGFMLIAGAFGLWAIQFATQAESRRRIGRLVETMDYLQDGFLAVDRRGRVTGANPVAKIFAGGTIDPQQTLQEVFPGLGDSDVTELIEATHPTELEKTTWSDGESRTLRFRSQHTDDLIILLISDVTAMEARRHRKRQAARIQLIGQLARGLAYDMNNLLCTISGHAALLRKLPEGSPDRDRSLLAINRSVDKGTSMAGHLLELSAGNPALSAHPMNAEYVRAAIQSLEDSLPPGWVIEQELAPLPPIALTGIKVEQIVLNLGLLIAEQTSQPSTLTIAIGAPDPQQPLFDVGEEFAGVLLIVSSTLDAASQVHDMSDEGGVIVSVIRTMIEDVDGRLDQVEGPDGEPGYRVSLPYKLLDSNAQLAFDYASELQPYVTGWHVLLAAPAGRTHELQRLVAALDVNRQEATDVAALLNHVEDDARTDAIILDEQLAPREWNGVIRALKKLTPGSALVLVVDSPLEADDDEAARDYVVIGTNASPQETLLAIIEARALAGKRS